MDATAWDARYAASDLVWSAEPNRFVELQGTAEHGSFSRGELDILLGHAERGIGELFGAQRKALGW